MDTDTLSSLFMRAEPELTFKRKLHRVYVRISRYVHILAITHDIHNILHVHTYLFLQGSQSSCHSRFTSLG